MFVLRYTFQFEDGDEFVDIYTQLIAFREKHTERTMRLYNNLTGPQRTVLWEVEFETVEEASQWLVHNYGDLGAELKAFPWFSPARTRTAALKTRELWRLRD